MKKLYYRIKYRRQLEQGFKLLDASRKADFVIMNDTAFIMNGQDPLVRVDLTTGEAVQYSNKAKMGYKITYKVSNK